MPEMLRDGTGNAYLAKVNNENRLVTLSITKDRIGDIAQTTSEAFLIATNFVSLTTTASFSGLLYIKNTSDKNLIVRTIRVCTTGTGYIQCKITRNPTAGTLISDANAAIAYSGNLDSSATIQADTYAASGDGKTITDGNFMTNFTTRSPGHSIENYDGVLIVPKNRAFAIECKPSVSTEVCVEVQCWFEEA